MEAAKRLSEAMAVTLEVAQVGLAEVEAATWLLRQVGSVVAWVGSEREKGVGVCSWKPEFLRQEESYSGRCCRWLPFLGTGVQQAGDWAHMAQLSRRPSQDVRSQRSCG